MNKKDAILFVDSWSMGLKFMLPVAELLSESFDVYFLNFDSLKKISSSEVKKTIVNFESNELQKYKTIFSGIYDIKSFGYSVSAAYKAINPKVIISISLHGFEHRYFNEVARLQGIPCVMYMHGLRGIKIGSGVNFYAKNIHKKILSVFYYSALYGMYFKDVRTVSNGLLWHMKRYKKLIFEHYKFIQNPGFDAGLDYQAINVIWKGDVEYYKENYGISNDESVFKVVGHIDTSSILKKVEQLESSVVDGVLLFVSQPLTRDGLITENDFERVVDILAQVSQKLGLKLVVRPHPRDNFEYLDKLRSKFYFVLSDKDLADDLAGAKVVAGLNSTVLLAAQALVKPMMLFDYASYPVHPILNKYPHGVVVGSEIEDFDHLIEQVRENLNPHEESQSVLDPVREIANTIKRLAG